MQYREALGSVKMALDHLAEAAGGLKNQNLADIVKHAGGKVAQAMDHPDVEAVDGLSASGGHPAPWQTGERSESEKGSG